MARTIQIPGYIHNLYHVVGEVRSRIYSHIISIALRYLKQEKLVSSSMGMIPSMREDHPTLRKALLKLSSFIERGAAKEAPYIKHISTFAPDFDLISVSRRAPCISMSGIVLCTEDSRIPNIVNRYVKYVNYLCRKHSLPLTAQSDLLDISELGTQLALSQLPGITPRRLRVSLFLTGQQPCDAETAIPIPFSALESLKAAIADTGGSPDSVYSAPYFANSVVWRTVPPEQYFHVGNLGELGTDTPASLLTPELAYFHLAHIIKGVISLSRKLSYVASAFSLEPAEQSVIS